MIVFSINLSISVDLKVLILLFSRFLFKRSYFNNKSSNRLKHPRTIKIIPIIVFDAAKVILSEFLNYLRGNLTTEIDRVLDRMFLSTSVGN